MSPKNGRTDPKAINIVTVQLHSNAFVVSPFPSLKAHGAALISVSLALSRTPAEAARPRIRGQCMAWYAQPVFAGTH